MNDEYFAGLFDAEGCASINFHETWDHTYRIRAQPMLRITLSDNYFCGLFDGDGCACLRLAEGGGRIKVSPALKIAIQDTNGLLNAIKEKYGGSISKSEGKKEIVWVLSGLQIEKAIDALLQNCVIKRPQLLVLKHLVLPLIRSKKHLRPDGLKKLIEIHKTLNRSTVKRKNWEKILERNILNFEAKKEPYYDPKVQRWRHGFTAKFLTAPVAEKPEKPRARK